MASKVPTFNSPCVVSVLLEVQQTTNMLSLFRFSIIIRILYSTSFEFSNIVSNNNNQILVWCSDSSASQELVPYSSHFLQAMGHSSIRCTMPSKASRFCQLHEEEGPWDVNLRIHFARRLQDKSWGCSSGIVPNRANWLFLVTVPTCAKLGKWYLFNSRHAGYWAHTSTTKSVKESQKLL